MWSRTGQHVRVRAEERARVDTVVMAAIPESAADGVKRSLPAPAGVARLGRALSITGIVNGQEALIIDGSVEGEIALPGQHLTIEQQARIKAKIQARTVVIRGAVVGEVEAEDRIEIHAMGRVQGSLTAPRVIIADGARFQGRVTMPEPPVPDDVVPTTSLETADYQLLEPAPGSGEEAMCGA